MRAQTFVRILSVLLSAAALSAEVDPELLRVGGTDARAARSWLERVSAASAEPADMCSQVDPLFAAARRRFRSAEALAEFREFASDGDTIAAWVAKNRLAETSDDRREVFRAMRESAVVCARCYALVMSWENEIGELKRLDGTELAALVAEWERVRHAGEAFSMAEQIGVYAQVMIATAGGHGHLAYFQATERGWEYLCSGGAWIA